MTKQEKCILEMYALIDDFTTRIERGDMSWVRTPSISGCNQYQGLPPISRLKNELFNKYEEVINEIYKKERD